MRAASEWQLAHSLGTLSGETGDVGSDTFLMSWTPWQSVQMATRVSCFISSCWPWTLVKYFAYWSVLRPYGFIRAGSAWQLAHRPTVPIRLGTPTNPLAGSMATVIWSELGSPPWQSAQVTPAAAW